MFDVNTIVQTGGILAIAAIVFAESGILLGLFLPGDTLLLTAGLFAGQGKLPIIPLVLTIIIAAVLGDQLGYTFGKKVGPRLFKRKSGILLRKDYIIKTEDYFVRYGPVTIVAARFIAHIRTLVPVIAGAGRMRRRIFVFYNVLGSVLWGAGITLLGYWLGQNVTNIDKYFFPVVIGGLVLIYAFTVYGLARSPGRRAALKKGLKEDFDYFVRGIEK